VDDRPHMQAITFDVRPIRWIACRMLGTFWPGVFWSALSGVRLRRVPVPALPADDWVRLRTRMGGICGSDMMAITLRHHPASFFRSLTQFPILIGHENVAVIDQIGPAVDGWHEGDRVCVEPMLSCEPRGIYPPCPRCAAGQFTLCENLASGALPPGTMIGWNSFTGGSWSEYFVAHKSQLFAIPPTIPDELAILTDPVACALHGVLRRRPADDERVLIIGSGILALAAAASIRAIGSRARVVALVRHEPSAELARRFGADEVVCSPRTESAADRYDRIAALVGAKRLAGRFGNQGMLGGFDVVYDCVGTGASLTDAMKFARGRGTVVALGTSQIAIVDTTPLWFAELEVLGCYGRQIEDFHGRRMHTYQLVFELIEQGKLRLEGLLTHRFRLTEYKDALAAATHRRRSGLIKAAFVHE